jgi:hypothetical protein
MPWLSRDTPASPGLGASAEGDETRLRWQADKLTARIAIQARTNGTWRTLRIVPATAGSATIPKADAVAITALCRYGNASPPKVLGLN